MSSTIWWLLASWLVKRKRTKKHTNFQNISSQIFSWYISAKVLRRTFCFSLMVIFLFHWNFPTCPNSEKGSSLFSYNKNQPNLRMNPFWSVKKLTDCFLNTKFMNLCVSQYQWWNGYRNSSKPFSGTFIGTYTLKCANTQSEETNSNFVPATSHVQFCSVSHTISVFNVAKQIWRGNGI